MIKYTRHYVFLFFTFLFLSGGMFSQQIYLDIDVVEPQNLTICQNTDTLTIDVNNPQTGVTSGTRATVTLPQGINYLSFVPNPDVSLFSQIGNQLTFDYGNIPGNSSKQVKLQILLSASCDFKQTFTSGLATNATVRFTFIANNINWSQNSNTNSLNFFEPNVDFSFISSQSHTGSVGDSYTRCYQIINNGTATVNEIVFKDIVGSSLSLVSMDSAGGNPIVYSQTGDTFTVVLDASNMPNGLAPGEIFEICEEINIDSCIGVTSQASVYWGCSVNDTCQISNSSTNVVFNDLSPNIAHSTSTTNVNNCYGPGATEHRKLVFYNTGNSTAYNTRIRMWAFTRQYSFIDTNSMTVINTANPGVDIFGPAIIDRIINNSNRASFTTLTPQPNNPTAYVYLNIPEIAVGDSIIVEFDSPKGCDTTINNWERKHFSGLFYQAYWDNQCGVEFNFRRQYPLENRYRFYRHSMTADGILINGDTCNSTTIDNGFSFTPSFLVNIKEFPYQSYSTTRPGPKPPTDDSVKFVFDIPACAIFSPATGRGVHVIDVDGTQVNPDRVTYDVANNQVVAVFRGRGNYEVKANIFIDLVSNCANCANTSGIGKVSVSVYYVPESTCNCELGVGYAELDVLFNCTSCTGELTYTDFCVYRENLGLPDDNDDGQPEAIWGPNRSRVRTDRVIYGDTIRSSMTTENWYSGSPINYLYAEVTASDSSLAYLGTDSIVLFNMMNGTSHSVTGNINTGYTSTTSGRSETHVIEIDIANLSTIPGNNLPTGFDISFYRITIFNRFIVNNNIGNATRELNFSSKFSGSTSRGVANTVSGCGDKEAQMTLLGYFIRSLYNDDAELAGCGFVNIYQRLQFSIGACCNNSAGGNFFPYEYRNFAVLDTFVIKTNERYNVTNRFVDYYRTSFNDPAANAFGSHAFRERFTALPISAPFQDADGKWNYEIPMSQLFQGGGGNVLPSDDGFDVYFFNRLEPTCYTAEAEDTLNYEFKYKNTPQFDGSEVPLVSAEHSYDQLYFERPKFFVQSTLPTIRTEDSTVCWTVFVNNFANRSEANNFWLGLENTGASLEVLSIKNVATNSILTSATDVYQVGILNPSERIEFEICAKLNSCDPDSLQLAFGWDCSGYPTDVASYDCKKEFYTLKVIPLQPSVRVSLFSLQDSVDLCEEITYETTIDNRGSGNAIDLIYRTYLVNGMYYVPGSAEIERPFGSGNFITFTDPALGTNLMTWDGAAFDGVYAQGLKGAQNQDSSKIKLRYKVNTSCPDYVSGQKIYAEVNGKSASCRAPFDDGDFPLNSVFIKSTIPSYNTSINVNVIDDIKPCSDSSLIRVKVINNGPLPVQMDDTMFIQLPRGIRYVPNSYQLVYNGNPTITNNYTQNIFEYVSINLDNILSGDSTVFTFRVYGIADSLQCDQSTLRFYTTEPGVATCNSVSCPISIVTGDTLVDVISFKSILDVVNSTGTYSITDAPDGEEVFVDLEMVNNGVSFYPSNDLFVSYFHDVDQNGQYSFSDTLISTTKISDTILAFTTYNFNDTVNLPSPKLCNIIVVIDSLISPCLCTSDEFVLNIDLRGELFSDTLCNGNTKELNVIDSINSYTYSWSPQTNLDNPNVATPEFTAPNIAGLDSTLRYLVQVDRGGCFTTDTVDIVVFNTFEPALTGNDTTICFVDSVMLSAVSVNFPNVGYWAVDSSNSLGVVIVDSANPSTYINNLQATNTMVWHVVNDYCGTHERDTIIITIDSLPAADAGTDITACLSVPTTNLIGLYEPTTAYTLWKQISGAAVTINNPTDATTSVTGYSSAGVYEFELLSANGVCDTARDTVVMNVVLAPMASITVDTLFECVISDSIMIAANPLNAGESGVWIPEGVSASVTNSGLNNDTIYIKNYTPGDYKYIWEVSIPGCSNARDSVIVHVDTANNAFAGRDTLLCNTVTSISSMDLGASYSNYANSIIQWNVLSGNANVSSTNSINTLITWTAIDTIDVELIAYNRGCDTARDTVSIIVYPETNAQIGLDTSLFCQGDVVTLLADSNLSIHDTGLWINPMLVYTYPDSIRTQVNGLASGLNKAYWTIRNGVCPPSIDSAVIKIDETPFYGVSNDTIICVSENTLDVSITPSTAYSNIAWRQLNGPSVTLVNQNTTTVTMQTFTDSGEVQLEVSVANGICDTVLDTVKVVLVAVSNAEVLLDTAKSCFGEIINVSANNTLSIWDNGVWTSTAGTFTSTNTLMSQLNGLNVGTHKAYWTVSNDYCENSIDSLIIVVDTLPTIDAGINDTLCISNFPYMLTGTITPVHTYKEWTVIGGNAGGSITNANSLTPIVNATDSGDIKVEFKVVNGVCDTVRDTITINIVDTTKADITLDTIKSCFGEIINVSANNTLSVWDNGVWTSTAGTFTSTNTLLSQLNRLNVGTHTAYWTVSNDYCANSIDSLIIIVDTLPTIDAGLNDTLCVSNFPYMLTGSITPVHTYKEWVVIGGNAGGSITNANSLTPIVNATDSGDIQVEFKVVNGVCDTVRDTILIEVVPSTQATIALDTVKYCQNQDFVLNASNNLTVYDSGYWTSPNGIFNSGTSFNDTISGLFSGAYKVYWNVKSSYCSTTQDSIILIIDSIPYANAGKDTSFCTSIPLLTMQAKIGPNTATGFWTQISGPVVSFGDSTSPSTIVNNINDGVIVLEWAVTNGVCGVVRDTMTINAFDPPTAIITPDTIDVCDQLLPINLSAVNTLNPYDSGFWLIPTGIGAVTGKPDSVDLELTAIQTGYHTFYWVVVNDYCDSSVDSIVVGVHETPNAIFAVNDPIVCLEECASITNNSSISTPYSLNPFVWVVNDLDTIIGNISEVCIDNKLGQNEIKLYVTSNFGCVDSLDDVYIQTVSRPIANFGINPVTDVIVNQEFTVYNLSTNFDDYTFIINGNTSFNREPAYSFPDSGTYPIIVVAENAYCSDTNTQYLRIFEDDASVFSPNTFTPNGDNLNEVFLPYLEGKVEFVEYELEIYNRWSNRVFFTDNRYEGWDGRLNESGDILPGGVYVWRIKYRIATSTEIEIVEGHVTLLR